MQPARFTVDALTGATPLDVLRTQLGLGLTVTEIRNSPVFGIVAGQGWEWAALGFLRAVCGWFTPAPPIGRFQPGCWDGLAVISTVFLSDRSAALRATVVSPVERRGDFRRILHCHRSGHGQRHAHAVG
jgi:hypothetical protein